jgi:CheY-like chemotaxis protein
VTGCGRVSSAGEAMDVIRKVKPHLVIADLGLKGTNGIELTKMIVAEFPRIPVLILSMHDESLYAVRSLRAGARGYVTKQEALGSVLEAVREVMDGQTYLSPKMASQVISKVVVNRVAPDEEITDRLKRPRVGSPRDDRRRKGNQSHREGAQSKSQDGRDASDPHQGKAEFAECATSRALRRAVGRRAHHLILWWRVVIPSRADGEGPHNCKLR